MDFTHCLNLRVIHISTITLDDVGHSGEEIVLLLPTTWTTRSHLAASSSLLDEIVFVFRPYGMTPEAKVAELDNFGWAEFVERVLGMFQGLRTVTVGIGYYARDNENVDPCFKAL